MSAQVEDVAARLEAAGIMTRVQPGSEGPYGSTEGDLVYDDGTIHAVCSVTNDPHWDFPKEALVIHGFGYNPGTDRGMGSARSALTRIREHCSFVIADNCIPSSLGFWRRMGEEGLIDVMTVIGGPGGGMTRFGRSHDMPPVTHVPTLFSGCL